MSACRARPGFVGEFLTLIGAFQANFWVAFFATFGVILSAAYALWLYWRVMNGPLDKPALAAIPDLNRREILLLAPLAILVIYYGVQPQSILDAFAAPTEAVLRAAAPALESAATALAGAQ